VEGHELAAGEDSYGPAVRGGLQNFRKALTIMPTNPSQAADITLDFMLDLVDAMEGRPIMIEEKKKVDPNLTVPVDDNPERPEIDPDKPKKDKKGKK